MNEYVIVASTLDQARLVAEQLDLPPGKWKMATHVGDLLGRSLDDVILALPNLAIARGHDIGTELVRLEQVQGKTVRTVWT